MLRAQEVAQYAQQLAQLRAVMGGQTNQLIGGSANQTLNYDTLKAQLDQQNAQRDTVLGAAGLNGASSGLGALTSYFGGKSSSGDSSSSGS
jgi:DNA repair exonuclease SbcCD ATPase subunit